MAACVQVPGDQAVEAERNPSVRRYDNFLAVASDGRQLLSAGGNGVIVTSTDGGKTWEREPLPAPSAVVAMSACPDGTSVALDFYRKVWVRQAQQRAWQPRPIEVDFNPLAISCDAHDRLWVVGSFSTIVSSNDRGRSWSAQPPGEDAILTAMQWVDANHGFIAGEFGTLLVTRDGGASWIKQAGLPEDFYPFAMTFTDAEQGWVSGLAGAILHTTDGGRNWTPQINPEATPIYALLHLAGRMFGVGGGGRILELQGDRWEALADMPRFPAYLAAGAPLESHALLVAGAAGALAVVSPP